MYETDIGTLKKETEVFRFGASTKGGQRANRKQTGIRLYHFPSGIRVTVKGRSQAKNLAIAFKRLQKKLRESKKLRKRRVSTRVPVYIRRRRLLGKKRHSEKKQLRKKPILG